MNEGETPKPVSSPADQLLKNPPDQAYLDEWAAILNAKPPVMENVEVAPAFNFRLGKEWFALNALIFNEIISPRKIHTIPHRTNKILLGVANLSGQLELCVSLHNLFGIPKDEEPSYGSYERMLAIQRGENKWMFAADEVYGIYHFDRKDCQPVPVTLSKARGNYLKCVFPWQNKIVGYIDEEVLFKNLRSACG